MASFVFPPDPAVDDLVTGSRGEIYIWDGEKWTWAPARSIEVKPGGDDTDIQFNDDGKFGGSDRFRIELQKDSYDTMGRTDLYIESRYTQGYGWTAQPALIHLRGTSMMNYPSTPWGYAGIVFENWAVNDYNQGPLVQGLIRCVNVLYGAAGNSTLDFFVQNSNQWRQMLSLGQNYGDITMDSSDGTFTLNGRWNGFYGQSQMSLGTDIDDGNDLYTLSVRSPYTTRPPDFNPPYNSVQGNSVFSLDASGSLCFGKYPNVNSGPPSYVWTVYPWWIQSVSSAYQQIIPLPIVFQPLGGNILIGIDTDGDGRLQVAGDINIIDPGNANGYTFRINGVPIGGGGGDLEPPGYDDWIIYNDGGFWGASENFTFEDWGWKSWMTIGGDFMFQYDTDGAWSSISTSYRLSITSTALGGYSTVSLWEGNVQVSPKLLVSDMSFPSDYALEVQGDINLRNYNPYEYPAPPFTPLGYSYRINGVPFASWNEVNGSIDLTNITTINGAAPGTGGSTQWSDGAGGIIYYNSGNVGVGVSNPAARVQIHQAVSDPSTSINSAGAFLTLSTPTTVNGQMAFGMETTNGYGWIQCRSTWVGSPNRIRINPLGGQVWLDGQCLVVMDTAVQVGVRLELQPGSDLIHHGTSGIVQVDNLPSSPPAAGTKRFWYDPADGNTVKFAV